MRWRRDSPPATSGYVPRHDFYRRGAETGRDAAADVAFIAARRAINTRLGRATVDHVNN